MSSAPVQSKQYLFGYSKVINGSWFLHFEQTELLLSTLSPRQKLAVPTSSIWLEAVSPPSINLSWPILILFFFWGSMQEGCMTLIQFRKVQVDKTCTWSVTTPVTKEQHTQEQWWTFPCGKVWQLPYLSASSNYQLNNNTTDCFIGGYRDDGGNKH